MKVWANIIVKNAMTTLAVLLSATLSGCMSTSESITADVPPGGWSEPIEIHYSNSDTIAIKSLTVALRHSASVPPSTGRYVVVSISPTGTARRDTLTIPIAFDPRRNRSAEAFADHHLRRRFEESGEWLFVVTPMQRTAGVWSVGIEIKNIR